MGSPIARFSVGEKVYFILDHKIAEATVYSFFGITDIEYVVKTDSGHSLRLREKDLSSTKDEVIFKTSRV